MRRTTPTLAPPPAAARDHDDAFVAFYEQWRTPLVRLATLLVDRVEVAEEIVQDAMAATYQRWPSLDEPAAFARAAVVNRSRSELRRRSVRRHRPVPEPTPAADQSDDVCDVVRLLPERQRTVVVLRFYADLPLAEIGALLGIHTGTVKSQLHKALAHLRKEISR
jgi:RNA polymerase sigma-70 factor (sigma-E family)